VGDPSLRLKSGSARDDAMEKHCQKFKLRHYHFHFIFRRYFSTRIKSPVEALTATVSLAPSRLGP
jgi:hypothetical protein